VIALVADLMVAVRIEEASKKTGARVLVLDSIDDLPSALDGATLMVADLAMPGFDIEAVASAAKEAGVELIGFYPHVDTFLRRAANDAGVSKVYPRSRFLRDLPGILNEGLASDND
jgi:hypothetical protein